MIRPPEPKANYFPVSGNIVFPQSLRIERARFSHFFFEGEKAKLEKFCDEWFNRTSRGRLRLKPISNTVILSFHNVSCTLGECTGYGEKREVCENTDCSIAYLRNTQGELLAGLKYNEIAFSFLVEDRKGNTFTFSPFRMIDDGIAMANYREAFGFADTYGEVRALKQQVTTRPESSVATSFCVEPDCTCVKSGVWLCCKTHLPQVDDDGTVDIGKNFSYPAKRVFWLENSETSDTRRARSWADPKEFQASLPGLLQETLSVERGRVSQSKKSYLLAEMATLGGKRLSLVQYRKSMGGPDAFYQAALAFKAEAVKIYGGGTIPGQFELKFWDEEGTYLNDLAFARDFGLMGKEPLIAKEAIWVDCDYELEPTEYLWINKNEDD